MPSVEEVECRSVTAHITSDQTLVAIFSGTVHRCSRAVHKCIIAAKVTVLVLPPSQAVVTVGYSEAFWCCGLCWWPAGGGGGRRPRARGGPGGRAAEGAG